MGKIKQELFDKAATNYDQQFSYSSIGQLQRNRVYHWMNKLNLFDQLKSVFEINCGTGLDAQKFIEKGINITATDASPEMIAYGQTHRNENINFKVMDFRDLDTNWVNADALFSNFGGLNCVNKTELNKILQTASNHQNRGEFIILVLMPKFCVMESLYLLSKFRFGSLFRRNTSKGVPVQVDGTEVLTYYHSPRSVKKMIQNKYRIKLIKPVAILLPPSYLEPFFNRWKRSLRILNSCERIIGRFSFFARFSDHYILIAERK